MTFKALRGYQHGGRAYGDPYDVEDIGTRPDLLAALAPTIHNLTGPGGPVSEDQLAREKGMIGEAIMGQTASMSDERIRRAGRSGYSRDIAMQMGERDRQRMGQKYRSEAEGVEASFAQRRGEVAKMVGDAAMGTTVAIAGLNQREKEERRQRAWYDRIQQEERKRRNKRALLGLGGALIGGAAGWMSGGGDGPAPQGGSPSGGSPGKLPLGTDPDGNPFQIPMAEVAESMMPNLAMQGIGYQMQSMHRMLQWSRMLQGAQLGLGLTQGFEF